MNLLVLSLGFFVIIDLLMLTLIVVSKSRRGFSEEERKKYALIWSKIAKMDKKQAIIEADKLLAELLRKSGYRCSLRANLIKAGPVFSDINALWSAHKLRNKLVHELGVCFKEETLVKALNDYKRAYRDLGLKL